MERKTLTAKEFLDILIFGEGDLFIDGYIIEEDVELTDQCIVNNPNREITIENCWFKHHLAVGAYNNKKQINFVNCHFREFRLSNSINFDLVINGGVIFRDLSLSADAANKITISKVRITHKLYITGTFNSIDLSDIEIRNRALEKARLSVIQARIQTFTITGLTTDEVKINSCDLISNTRIYKLRAETFSIINTSINTVTELSEIVLDKFSIYTTEDKALQHRYLSLNSNSQIKEADFFIGAADFINIANSELLSINLIGYNREASIFVIDEVKFNKLNFSWIINKGSITLRELTPLNSPAEIIISNSTLGRTEFIHCHFSNEILKFNNSRITDIFISDSDFPKLVYKEDSNEFDYIQAKLAFGQIHTALSKQGDTVRGLEYQSREIAAHFKTLPLVTSKYPWLNLTKINLWLNWASNDYGRNWGRGIVFTFVIGLIFFSLLLISTDRYQWGMMPNIECALLPGFLKFMNPLRFFDLELLFKSGDKTCDLGFTPISYLWDFLGRVFVAYGFYQTIQAFRRYGRK